jgi:putative PIN family toxin of toxin-antitoxin system
MKIVLDTNVLIAAFITRGVCSDVLEHCIRRHALITSEFILNEFREKMVRKFKYSVGEVEEAVELLRSTTKVVMPADLGMVVCRDPDDDIVLGTAVAGNAPCIVTGDADLLVLRQFQGIDLVRPIEFADYESAQSARQ